jgi:molecular chaperone Hsp33
MIKSLGKSEAEDILVEKGKIQVSCEFCNAIYEFDSVDVKQLFESIINLPDNKTTH